MNKKQNLKLQSKNPSFLMKKWFKKQAMSGLLKSLRLFTQGRFFPKKCSNHGEEDNANMGQGIYEYV